MTRRTFLAAVAAGAAPLSPARSTMGFSPDCFGQSQAPRTAREYLSYASERGAGGVQAVLPSLDPAYLRETRARAEALGMYLEITTPLPRPPDTAAFEATVRAAREAGAAALRSVCLSGRRYETFRTLDDWKAFVADSHARLAAAVPVVERHKIPLGLENHKDWTIEEMVPLLRQYSSEYLGACIDWGNNLALCDDPVELVEALAPFAVNSHIKDMAIEEYGDGFRLAEVPLGQGFLPLARMLETIRRARPQVRFSLDMLTRDPLDIPCLTESYWATWTARHPRYLARTLRLARAHRSSPPLTRVTPLDREARRALEQQNVRQSVDFARDTLGLRPA